MKTVRLENVTKYFQGETILDNVSLTIPAGQFFALLGPSGCGKTTLLRLIGGFEKPDSGTILLGDQDITQIPINKRSVNTVFQNYALFPHLNVFDNVAYSLRVRRVAYDIIEQKVIKMLRIVGLEAHVYKSVQQLSGGQQQRVALARAIINEPDVLLLDEPLAALDQNLRERMLVELIDLQEALKTTFIYVTHDQIEALTVADQMAIMNPDGDIEQIGTPRSVYEFPRSRFVARFVGATNNCAVTVKECTEKTITVVTDLGEFVVFVPEEKSWISVGVNAFMSVRPEKILISKAAQEHFSNHIKGLVESIVYHGRSTQYKIRVASGETILVFEQNNEHFPQEHIDYDDEVYLYWQKENAVLLER